MMGLPWVTRYGVNDGKLGNRIQMVFDGENHENHRNKWEILHCYVELPESIPFGLIGECEYGDNYARLWAWLNVISGVQLDLNYRSDSLSFFQNHP
jgi:hypothetical protein